MFSREIIGGICLLYMILLFGTALWVEKRSREGKNPGNNPVVYALSILVYLTAWTFYGSVGRAASTGTLFLTFYLGPTLIMLLWYGLLRKMIRIKNKFRITSLADFISLRYDRSLIIAAMVTVITLIGIIPYIALQLKAIIATYAIVTGFPDQTSVSGSSHSIGLIACFFIIIFTIMIGVRRPVPMERHQGMVMAMVLESVVKLVGLLAIGIFVTFFIFNGFSDVFDRFELIPASQDILQYQQNSSFYLTWMSYMLLSMSAFMFLPRQFHMSVIENFQENHLRTAMWLCPLYFLLITIFILPIAMGGLLLGFPINLADSFVLLIPMQSGHAWLSLLVFIGGFSASTGMIMISAMTISTMVTNHLVLPVLDRVNPSQGLKKYILQFRWLTVILLVLTSYWFYQKVGAFFTLVDFGIIAFAAVLQFVPSIIGALYWKRGHKSGVMLGTAAGFLIWFYTLILPVFVRSGLIANELLINGPWGLQFLRPEKLFGLTHLDPVTHATFLSLLINTGLYVLASLKHEQSPDALRLADAYVDAMITGEKEPHLSSVFTIDQNEKREKINILFRQYFLPGIADSLTQMSFNRLGVDPGNKLSITDLAELNNIVETELAGAIGAATAHQAILNSGIILPEEETILKSEYSSIIAKLKLSPTDLISKINFYQEREKLLFHQANELEEKIQERDREIVERKRVEEELVNSEKQLAEIINFHPDPTFAIDMEGKITIWNRAAEEFTGCKAEDMIGKKNYEYALPFYGERRPILIDLVFKQSSEVENLYPHISRTGNMVTGETTTRSLKRGEAYLIGTAAPLYDSEGRIRGAIESIRDITDRKKEEEELFQSRQMLQLVLDNVPQRIFWKDWQSTYMGCNKPLAIDCGFSDPDDLIGKTDYETASAAMAELYREDDRQVLTSGQAKLNYEEPQLRPDGSRAWLRTSKIPLRDESNRVIAVLGLYEDITERKNSDIEIRRLNRVYALLSDMNQMIVRVSTQENLLDEICRISVETGKFQLAAVGILEPGTIKQTLVTGYGQRPDDMEFFELSFKSACEECVEGIEKTVLNGIPFIANDIHRDCYTASWIDKALQINYRSYVVMPVKSLLRTWGALYLFSSEYAFFDDPEIQMLEDVAANFSFALETIEQENQRRRAEIALQKSEDRYRTLVENLHEVVFILDVQGIITYISPAIYTLSEYYPEDIIGQHFEVFVHPEDIEDVRLSFYKTLEGLLEPLEFRIICKDGSKRWIRSSSNPQFFEDRLIGLQGIFSDISEYRRAEAEIRQRLIELEAVHRVSVALRSAVRIEDMLSLFLNETLAVMNSESGCLWLMNPESKELDHCIERGWCSSVSKDTLHRREGIAGIVLKTGKSVLCREFASEILPDESGFEYFPAGWGGVCVPVRATNLVIGLILVSVQLPRVMTANEERLLITLSEIVGNSIHRISLHERTERQVRHLNAMHTIDRAISASLDLNVTMEILLDQVLNLSGADATDVVVLNLDTQKLIPVANRGFHSMRNAQVEKHLGDCPASRVIFSRQPVFIPKDLDKEPVYHVSENLIFEGFAAYHAWPLIAKGQVKGVLEVYHRTPFQAPGEWIEFLTALAAQAAVAVDNITLLNALQTTNQELMVAYDATLEGWARALELHDQETEGHSRRVIELTISLARAIGIDEKELVHIRRGALLHDIGKMGIPDEILKKPGKLTDEEWEIMVKHPDYAFRMLYPILYLRPALDIPYAHHEKWDGSGYPRNLSGEKIPIAARVFAIVDVFDALLSERPYRKAWPRRKAVDYISSQSGMHFDPLIVDKFLTLIE